MAQTQQDQTYSLHYLEADDINQETLSTNLRGFLYGDGFFTTGKAGSKGIAFRQYHLQRIEQSAKKLQFSPLDWTILFYSIEQGILQRNWQQFRITVSRRSRKRGYALVGNEETIIAVSGTSEKYRLAEDHEYAIVNESSISASVNPDLYGLKHCNRLDNVLAASQIEAPYNESIMFAGDRVVGGTSSNLFVMLDGGWYTPELPQAGVLGVMRQVILSTLVQNRFPVKCIQIKRADLADAEQMFLTNCLKEIWPVATYQKRNLTINELELNPLQTLIKQLAYQFQIG